MSNTPVASFHPERHLITLKTADGPTAYYPFWWQLHTFRLRCPHGSVAVEIVHFDVERDFVLVKALASLTDGDDGFGTGLASGSLTLVDQVTQRAKSQALLDLGIGCAWPILFRDDLERADVVVLAGETTSAHDEEDTSCEQTSSSPLPLPSEQTSQDQHTPQVSAPVPTVSQVREFFARVYRVKPADLETRWARFKLHYLQREIGDTHLSSEQLRLLHAEVTQHYERITTDKLSSTAGRQVRA